MLVTRPHSPSIHRGQLLRPGEPHGSKCNDETSHPVQKNSLHPFIWYDQSLGEDLGVFYALSLSDLDSSAPALSVSFLYWLKKISSRTGQSSLT